MKSVDAKRTKPEVGAKLTRVEIDTLLVTMMKSSRVRAAACRFVKIEHFNQFTELAPSLLAHVIAEIAPKYADVEAIPYVDLRTATNALLEMCDASVGDAERADLMRVPTDSDPRTGLIYHAYKNVSRDDFTELAALELLKRFVTERVIHARIKELLLGVGDRVVSNYSSLMAENQRLAEELEAITRPPLAGASFGERSDPHEATVARDRGRGLLGLKTGLVELDARTLGLRGLTTIAAAPGRGKTALTLALAVGACRYHEDNDAVVLYLSLEMDADKIMSRLKAHASGLDWKIYRLGSPGCTDPVEGTTFNAADLAMLKAGEERAREWQLDRRLFIFDRAALGGSWDAAAVIAQAKEAKILVGASRVLVVIDHLQYVPLPHAGRGEKGDEDDDDTRKMALVRDIILGLKTDEDPDPAVLLVSQARKPPTSADAWGTTMSEVMGKAEITFASDAVLLLSYVTPAEVANYYDVAPIRHLGPGAKAAACVQLEERRLALEAAKAEGISPTVLNFDKAREGTEGGRFAMEFAFRKFRFGPVKRDRFGQAGLPTLTRPAPTPAAEKATPARLEQMRSVVASAGPAAAVPVT
jgi:hypothetical protein